MSEKIVTQPHNPYLLNTFRAFSAEGLAPPAAVAMTQAHIAHGQMAAINEAAKHLHRIADVLERFADPVIAGQFVELIKAQGVKRAETKENRYREEAKDAIARDLFGDAGL